jgi:predicted TIM-barrel fold metal-dependent hydrolase
MNGFQFFRGLALAWVATAMCGASSFAAPASKSGYEFHDSHFHLTNYIQEGITAKYFLDNIMGKRVGRSTLFGIPLQQQWSYRVSGKDAPTYYLDTDASLYYYSFTDAYIAMQYRGLSKKEQARFDPMITGFNPTDMYAADHIRRVLQTFPGVFTGIGEFTIHKEFVSPKIDGDVASLSDPALDRILDFAGEVGLVVLIHNDIDKPFPKANTADYLPEIKALFKRHPKTTIIWAHIGLGRVIHPIEGQATAIGEILRDPAFNHVYFDISWDEVAKYAVASETSIARISDALNRYPDRFLFGTDTVAPRADAPAEARAGGIQASETTSPYFKVFEMWNPVWERLTPEAREKVCLKNYERIFNEGRRRVRAWEKANAK